MSDPSCHTCKHWAPLPLKHPQAARKGLCRALCIVPASEPGVLELTPARLATLGHQHPLTAPEFTCAYWEAT